MTKFEFEDRTGLKVTDEEFKGIEAMYYAVPNMQKDEFCKRWRQCGNNPLAVELAKQVTALRGMLDAHRNTEGERDERNSELADFLISKATAYEDSDFYKQAVKMIGQKEVTLRKVKKGLPLWEEDLNYIIKYLK